MKEPMERENRLASYLSYKVFISKICKELIQSLARKQPQNGQKT